MKNVSKIAMFLILGSLTFRAVSQNDYRWKDSCESSQMLAFRIPVPEGYRRVEVFSNSFGEWLRQLPLKPGTPKVMLYNGEPKHNQNAHYRVIDIDAGTRDLQQCADAVMRLKAEYHFACGEYDRIHFNFTSGDRADYTRYREGYRPQFSGNKVTWTKSAAPDASYRTFRKYMDLVFSYAGTFSLDKELTTVPEITQIQPGDVFIQGGFPGHAVIVVDVAENIQDGSRIFLLAQSYMPAQEMHVLRNPENHALSPWFLAEKGPLFTPEWNFPEGTLKRFGNK
ncbi:MAG: DUF4846 domain-containing protein [Bacteroidia bacterium]|nr:DUF4846 domain-containing protein [Bacteroidia bacterium]